MTIGHPGQVPRDGEFMSNTFNRQVASKETEQLPMLKKILYILNAKQKRQCIGLGVMILISGLLETVGVSLIVPIVSAITSPETIEGYLEEYAIL